MKPTRTVGRPAAKPEDRRVRLSVRVEPQTRQALEWLAKENKTSMGREIDRMFEEKIP